MLRDIRVAVECEDLDSIEGVQESHRVTPASVGGIDDHGQAERPEQLDDLRCHDGDMEGGSALLQGTGLTHGQPPGALAPTWKRAE